ncbi:flagellar basal body rod protein FlgC [Hankyongella ginsenosidimutans]|uniref:Flagellar basal-body rod protein FlgC n=1 Tax=Hankyongella ginsenosidimutans TaxID=1763828 RepID=A0A4D7C801_9SPHN|nr:flagellar basal body rod protein FlgC [Hankyongella ginsenosidimutans]QCI80285.1 flagellar basal body rod protein FlgC [Hankyongella ginsenosidimutans]TXG83901.1 MAG: flagellar basal body rod protein FlgC [Sphingomonadales bacterium]
MAGDLDKALVVSASGLRAQSLRMRVIAENIANQDSVAATPGGQPYRRKIVQFKSVLDRETGAKEVAVRRVTVDPGAFGRKYAPGHPAADAQGYVLTPNVNGLIESSDLREAQRTYEANLSSIESAKQLATRTIDLLR